MERSVSVIPNTQKQNRPSKPHYDFSLKRHNLLQGLDTGSEKHPKDAPDTQTRMTCFGLVPYKNLDLTREAGTF